MKKETDLARELRRARAIAGVMDLMNKISADDTFVAMIYSKKNQDFVVTTDGEKYTMATMIVSFLHRSGIPIQAIADLYAKFNTSNVYDVDLSQQTAKDAYEKFKRENP